MKRTCTLLLLALLIQGIAAQETEEKRFGIRFSGFVKNDFFLDSRQTVAARNGHFLLWPSPRLEDPTGADINAQPVFNILAIQSRLKGTITGPEAFGAKTSGIIEGDFFAQANDNINLFRLRHAFVKLDWERIEFMAGQTWNPLFITQCFPGTVSFNTGVPLQSFARNPQIRLTLKLGSIRIMGAALSQLDYNTWGMDGANCKYIRNSATPDMHFRLQYEGINPETGTGFHLGGGVAHKTIVPRLQSDMAGEEYKVEERVAGTTVMAYVKWVSKPVTIKAQARYGENISDVLSISGYAVREVTDPVSGEQSYTPLWNLTYWGEIHTNGTRFQAGLFAGYLSNRGTRQPMSDASNPVYGLATDIRSLVRVSPRIMASSGKVRFALELEYTWAAYGEEYDANYLPARTVDVANLRTLASVFYFF